jgi:trans-aconitate 2-methyltransferase
VPWNPFTYNQYKSERSLPFVDLLAMIKSDSIKTIIYLGCGTGDLTEKLSETFRGAHILGIDNSPEMLADAQSRIKAGLNFQLQSIEELILSGKKYDLVFSNAALQWIENHYQLIPSVYSMVSPGGQLAVQVPSNDDHLSHSAIRKLASSSPYKEALNRWIRTSPVLTIDEYAQILFSSGATDINVFEKVYPIVMPDSNALTEWTKGTALVPYLEKLSPELTGNFLSDYRRILAAELPSKPLFYAFKRTFLYARKG